MVFYTCSGCGEALKKNKVEKHVYTCGGCEYLTCIDCGKDFYEDEYKNHNQCITEDQKYSAKGTQFKPNKGDVKQQQWLQNIESVMSSSTSLSKKARDVISSLKNCDNIPRKRPKFLNFLKNSFRMHDAKIGEEIWEAFSAASKKETVSAADTAGTRKNTEPTDKSENKNSETVGDKKAKKLKKEKSSKAAVGNSEDQKTKEDNVGVAAVNSVDNSEDPLQIKKHKVASPCDESPKIKKKKKKSSKQKNETDSVTMATEDCAKEDTTCDPEIKKKKKKKRQDKIVTSCCEKSHTSNSDLATSEPSDGNCESIGRRDSEGVATSDTAQNKNSKKKKSKSVKTVEETGNATVNISAVSESIRSDSSASEKPKKKKKLRDSGDKKNGKKNKIAEVDEGNRVIESAPDETNVAENEPLSNDVTVKKIKKKKRKKQNEDSEVLASKNPMQDGPPTKKKKKKHKNTESDKDVVLDR